MWNVVLFEKLYPNLPPPNKRVSKISRHMKCVNICEYPLFLMMLAIFHICEEKIFKGPDGRLYIQSNWNTYLE